MAELSDDYVSTLKRIRGEFVNSKGGRIGNRVLAHVFSTLFPLFFVGYLVFWSDPGWPLTGEQWLYTGLALLTCGVGVLLHRIVNCRYVLDEVGVHQYQSNGTLRQSVRWDELVRVDYQESRGIKNFILRADGKTLNLEFYKSLGEAFKKAEAGNR